MPGNDHGAKFGVCGFVRICVPVQRSPSQNESRSSRSKTRRNGGCPEKKRSRKLFERRASNGSDKTDVVQETRRRQGIVITWSDVHAK